MSRPNVAQRLRRLPRLRLRVSLYEKCDHEWMTFSQHRECWLCGVHRDKEQ